MRRLHWRAISRGLAIERVVEFDSVSRFTAAALTERGIDRRHTSARRIALTWRDLARADLAIALCEVEHRPMIEETHPALADRVIYWNVRDLPHQSPEDALSEIECQVLLLLNLLVGRELTTAPLVRDLNQPREGLAHAKNCACMECLA
jgi:protein-tyrosine phosphatase